MGWGCTPKEAFREKVGSEWRLGGGKEASCTEILDESPPGRGPSQHKEPRMDGYYLLCPGRAEGTSEESVREEVPEVKARCEVKPGKGLGLLLVDREALGPESGGAACFPWF